MSSHENPISPLRQRMIEDMTVRNFTAATQRDYIRGVKTLAESAARVTPFGREDGTASCIRFTPGSA